MNKLEHRENLGAWLNDIGLVGVGVEVGVAFGGYSRIILQKWKGRLLHLVDLWKQQPAEDYCERTNEDDPFDLWYRQAQELAAHDKRVLLWRGYSHEIAREFADNFLDFVYLDANHGYDWVKQDIESWWPKVKPGGVLLGHDYYNDVTPPHYCEVQRAVEDWVNTTRIPVHFTRETGPTWYAFKP